MKASPLPLWAFLLPDKGTVNLVGAPKASLDPLIESRIRRQEAISGVSNDASGGYICFNPAPRELARLRQRVWQWQSTHGLIRAPRRPLRLVALDQPAQIRQGVFLSPPHKALGRCHRWFEAARLTWTSRMRRPAMATALPRPPALIQALAPLTARPLTGLNLLRPHAGDKLVLQVLTPGGDAEFYLKIPLTSAAQTRLNTEVRMLQHPMLKQLVPKAWQSGEILGRPYVAQAALPGSQPPAGPGKSVYKFLSGLHGGSSVPAHQHPIWQRARQWVNTQPDLVPAWKSLVIPMAGQTLPTTAMHGDFCSWNLRIQHGKIRAFDWENAELQGLPLMDLFHYLLQFGFLVNRWSSGRTLAQLQRLENSADFQAHRQGMGINASQVRPLLGLYLIQALASRELPRNHHLNIRRKKLLDHITAP